MPKLMQMVTDSEDQNGSLMAAEMLGEFGVQAKEAVASLIRAAKIAATRQKEWVHDHLFLITTIKALGKIGPGAPEVSAILQSFQNESDLEICKAASEALSKIRMPQKGPQ